MANCWLDVRSWPLAAPHKATGERLLLAETSRWWHRVASVRFTPKAAAELE